MGCFSIQKCFTYAVNSCRCQDGASHAHVYSWNRIPSGTQAVNRGQHLKKLTNTSLPISSSTRQHFVDAHNVEWVQAYPHVEGVLAAVLHHVLVGADAASFQGLSRQLLKLIRHEVDAQGEVIHACLLAAQVKDTDLGVCRGKRFMMGHLQVQPLTLFEKCHGKLPRMKKFY